MNCTWTKPCSICVVLIAGKTVGEVAPAKTRAKRIFRLHLHPAPAGKGHVTLALHRALGVKMFDAKLLVKYGGWVPESAGKHADQLLELARRIDRLAKAPIAVVR